MFLAKHKQLDSHKLFEQNVNYLKQYAFVSQPTQPTLSLILSCIQLLLVTLVMYRRLTAEHHSFMNEGKELFLSLLPLVIASCFRNLAIASGQGKQAMDLGDKVEDLTPMELPSSLEVFLQKPSIEYETGYVTYAIEYLVSISLH